MNESKNSENGNIMKENKTVKFPAFLRAKKEQGTEENGSGIKWGGSSNVVSKKERNKSYIHVTYLFSIFFLSLIGYLVYFNIVLKDDLNKNPNNAKADVSEAYVTRGSIYSSDGQILAGTNLDEMGNEIRVYPWSNVFAHVVGYTVNGKSGVEAIYNNDLLTSNASIKERVGREANNEKMTGDSLILTLDTTLQRAAYNALGAYKGAVVVLEPSTGRILAMVSKPDFDPNYMESEWEYLNADDSNSPLLNRATQGLYPPGSTFKILTALEYIREHPFDYQNYAYECYSTITQNDVTIKCYGYEMHGYEDLLGSFQHSCNTSFANIGLGLKLDKFEELAKEMMFGENLPIALPSSRSYFTLNENSSVGEIMTTSIGQGNTLVSPLHMAMITAAVANEGRAMVPYVVERTENSDGITVSTTKPKVYREIMTTSEAGILKSFMQSVVEGGTASSLWNGDYTVAGKTGSAEYEMGELTGNEENFGTHSWFVGFSNVDDPDIAVAVIAEDGGTGSSAAVPIAQQIFNAYYYGY